MNVNTVHTIFGAGTIGTELCALLVAEGHQVRMVSRHGSALAGATAIKADSCDQEAAMQAAKGSDVVYNCTNAPYNEWPKLLFPLYRSIQNAAEKAKARYVYLDNLYPYGAPNGPITESSPEAAQGTKATIRRQLGAEVLEAHKSGALEAAILRASDFYGPDIENAWLGDRAWEPLKTGKNVMLMGNPDAPHSFAFKADVARALMTLGTTDHGLGRVWFAPHAPALSPREMLEIGGKLVGKRPKSFTIRRPMLQLMGLFSPIMKEMLETYPSFSNPYVVDSSAFESEYGWKATPMSEGIAASLQLAAGVQNSKVSLR